MIVFKNRPIFAGFICASYSLCGLINSLGFFYLNNLKININATIALALIGVFLVGLIFYESPMFYFLKGNYNKFLMALITLTS